MCSERVQELEDGLRDSAWFSFRPAAPVPKLPGGVRRELQPLLPSSSTAWTMRAGVQASRSHEPSGRLLGPPWMTSGTAENPLSCPMLVVLLSFTDGKKKKKSFTDGVNTRYQKLLCFQLLFFLLIFYFWQLLLRHRLYAIKFTHCKGTSAVFSDQLVLYSYI